MVKKLLKYSMSLLAPKILKNIYLMLKFRCIVHPSADIKFINNIKIGKGTVIGKAVLIAQSQIDIGEKCFINDYVIINSKTGYVKIGDLTYINHNSVIFGNGGVVIGKNCAIGLNVQIIKNHPIPADKKSGYNVTSENKTIIGDCVWLCSNVVIVDGVSIGSYSIVGANSFVSRDIPESVISGGIPAKVIKARI